MKFTEPEIRVHSAQKGYPNVTSIGNESPLIVKGKVIESKTTGKFNAKAKDEGDGDQDWVAYTDKAFKIQKIYKGTAVKPGDIINIRVLEGEVNGLKQVPDYTIQHGKSYVLCLKPSRLPVKNSAFAIEGGDQGIFELKANGKVENIRYKGIDSVDLLETELSKVKK